MNSFRTRLSLTASSLIQQRRRYAAAGHLSAFDERWSKLTQVERDKVAVEFEPLQKSDWKTLTLDQKKMCTSIYTIAYGEPEIKDPKENLKIFLATAGLIGVAVGLFAFIRSFANPPPKTTFNKEWQEASKARLVEQKANPIAGISYKHQQEQEQADDKEAF